MSISKKQRKALAPHKAIVRKRNIRTNNMKVNPAKHISGGGHSYRLYDL